MTTRNAIVTITSPTDNVQLDVPITVELELGDENEDGIQLNIGVGQTPQADVTVHQPPHGNPL